MFLNENNILIQLKYNKVTSIIKTLSLKYYVLVFI